MDEFRKIDKNLIEHVASGQEIRITGRELQDVEFTPPGGNHTNPTGEYLQNPQLLSATGRGDSPVKAPATAIPRQPAL